MPELTTTANRAAVHLPWVDFAKGLCMVLVVLFHSALFMETQVNKGYVGFWTAFSAALSSLRMPIFFFVSGLLATNAIWRSLSETRVRTIGMFYLYAIWTFVFLLRVWMPQPRRADGSAPEGWMLLVSLLLPTSFWYLYALPVFFLAAWVLVRVLGRRSFWALLPLGLLSAMSLLIHPFTDWIIQPPFDRLKLPSLAANFVWFFLGLHSRTILTKLMSKASYARMAGSAVAYLVLWLAMMLLHLGLSLKVLLAVIALYFMAQVVALVDMKSRPATILSRIGKQTLPVYIGHIFLISITSAVVKATGLTGVLQANLPLSNALVPPLMVVPIIWLSLLAGRWIRNGPLWWMLQAPPILTGKPRKALSAQASPSGKKAVGASARAMM